MHLRMVAAATGRYQGRPATRGRGKGEKERGEEGEGERGVPSPAAPTVATARNGRAKTRDAGRRALGECGTGLLPPIHQPKNSTGSP